MNPFFIENAGKEKSASTGGPADVEKLRFGIEKRRQLRLSRRASP
jgi:hypothetical protein